MATEGPISRKLAQLLLTFELAMHMNMALVSKHPPHALQSMVIIKTNI
jgi:hypothetical protein